MKSKADDGNFDGQEVTAEQLGALLEITARRVRELAETGVFPRKSRGRYALGPSVRAYLTALKQRERRETDLEAEQRLLRGKADKIELEVLEKRGILRDVATVERAVEEWTRTERANLLGLPAQYADTMAAELTVDPGPLLYQLKTMIREHLAREAVRAFTLADRLEKAS